MGAWVRDQLVMHFPICKDANVRFGIMHRLDMQTSGVVLCAKSYMGAHWIKMQWCSHGVKKDYVCLAHGWVDTSVTEINKRIAKKAEQLNQFMTERCFVSELG